MKNPILETKRLILREWQDSDLPAFIAMNQDSRVMEFFPALRTASESRDGVAWQRQHFAQHGFCCYAVELKATHEFIGFTGLSIPPYQTPFTPCVEIGWRLAYRFWNQGYATEAARAALSHGFLDHHLPEIVSFTATLNQRSMRVMEKLGMHRDPREDFDHPNIPNTHPLARHVLYRITREEYQPITD